MKTYILGAVMGAFAVLAFLSVRSGGEEVTQVASDADGTQESVPDDATITTPKETPPVVSGKALDMSGKGLTKVPESVFSQTSLVSLNLSNNELDGALQAEVRHLRNLVSLDLSNNNFTGVPAEMGQLSKLRYLDLSNNQLTGLPYELGNLKNLETLILTGNNYSEQDLEVIRNGLPDSTHIITG